MKNLIVTHQSDVDGILAGALLARYLMVSVELIFCTYPMQRQVFIQLAELRPGRKIYISDISAKDFLLPGSEETVLERIANSAEKIEWWDHHPNTESFAPLLKKYGHKVVLGAKEKICATELIRRNLLLDDDYAEFLGRVAQAHDYEDTVGATDEIILAGLNLQKIISLFNAQEDIKSCDRLLRLIAKNDSWYQGGEFSPWLKEIVFTAETLIKQTQKSSLGNRFFLNVKGRRFVITCAEAILPQKESLARLRDEFAGQVDSVAIYSLPPVGHLLFYKDMQSDFNVQRFCEFVGGGGRDGNGGFSPPIKVGQKDFQIFVDYLAKKLEEFI